MVSNSKHSTNRSYYMAAQERRQAEEFVAEDLHICLWSILCACVADPDIESWIHLPVTFLNLIMVHTSSLIFIACLPGVFYHLIGFLTALSCYPLSILGCSFSVGWVVIDQLLGKKIKIKPKKKQCSHGGFLHSGVTSCKAYSSPLLQKLGLYQCLIPHICPDNLQAHDKWSDDCPNHELYEKKQT